MPRIAKFKKDAQDRIRYTVDYVNWLEETEEITTVTVVGNDVDDDFVCDDEVSIDTTKKIIIFYVSGGDATKEYDVYVTITTTLNQIKEDWVTIKVT